MTKPTGLLEVEAIIPGPSSQLAARGTVVVRDAAGLQWCFPATYFAYDLNPYTPSQTLDFTQWKDAVIEALFPSYSARPEVDRFDFQAAYRAGHAPEVAAQAIHELSRSAWERQWEEGAST